MNDSKISVTAKDGTEHQFEETEIPTLIWAVNAAMAEQGFTGTIPDSVAAQFPQLQLLRDRASSRPRSPFVEAFDCWLAGPADVETHHAD